MITKPINCFSKLSSSSYLLKLPIATDYSDQRNLTCQAKIMGQWTVCSSTYLYIIQKYES